MMAMILMLELDFTDQRKFIIKTVLSIKEVGFKNLLNSPYLPYDNYLDGPFPSGKKNKEIEIRLNFFKLD